MNSNSQVNDDPLPVTAACQLLQIDRGHIYDWRARHLLEDRGPEGALTRRDAVEAAVLVALTAALGASKARMAYRAVREEVRRSVPPTNFEVVWVDPDRTAIVTRTDADLLARVRRGKPTVVVSPAERISTVLQAWSTEIEDRTSSPPPRHPRGKKRAESEELG